MEQFGRYFEFYYDYLHSLPVYQFDSKQRILQLLNEYHIYLL